MSSKRKLFHEKLMTAVEKYFVTDTVIYRAGIEDCGIISINASKSLPKYIEQIYPHKDKTNEIYETCQGCNIALGHCCSEKRFERFPTCEYFFPIKVIV